MPGASPKALVNARGLFFYRDKGGGKERLGHFVETSWQEDLCVHFHLLFPVG